MTQKLSRLPGWMKAGVGARGLSDAQAAWTSMRARVLSWVLRPITPPLSLGLAVAAVLIAAESLLVYLLTQVVPGNLFGVVFLLGVLVISLGWGFRLGTMTALASALVYAYFHYLQTGGSFIPTEPRHWVAVTVFLVIALSATALAGVARLRAVAADQRRREVEASHDELSALADHQAALRRVATLVARGVTPSEMFSAVAEELARCLGVYHHAVLFRYEPDGAGVLLAAGHGDRALPAIPVGERFSLDGESVAAQVFCTCRAARMDSYTNASGPVATRFRDLGLRAAVGAPIIVDGCLWGAAIVGSSRPEPLPPDTEARVGDFTDLVATAIANAQTRADLAVLAEQQAALRRVATLVARGEHPSELFSAVAGELARCLGVHHSTLFRYEPDRTATLLAARHERGLDTLPIGKRFSIQGDNIAAMVYEAGRTARIDSHDNATGLAAKYVRNAGIRSSVGAPIIVDGRLWGVAIVGSSRPEPLPSDTEARVGDFADLVATAIANAHTHSELTASRVRIVAAADDARRRIERDLHDGAQQRLVSLGLELRTAEARVPAQLNPLKEQISALATRVAEISTELQELSRGIHPAILSKGGLSPALKALARRSAIPVELVLAVDRRLPDSAEVAAYYVVAEALTNAAKYSNATEVKVCVDTDGPSLHLSVRDDGIGGADTTGGSGLIGLIDRVEALGGTLTISSRVAEGTSLEVNIPFECE
jgi:signal transduction histidine kinase